MTDAHTDEAPAPPSGTEEDAAAYWSRFGLDVDAGDPMPPRSAPDADGAEDPAEVEDVPPPQETGATTTDAEDGARGAPISEPDPRPARGFARATVALTGVIVVLAVVVGILLPGLISARRAEDRRDEVTQVTRQMMTNLVTLRFDTAQADVDRLLDGATGSFREQFGGQAGAFRNVLEQGRVVSTGHVTEVGVQDVTDENATALAAVRARVANSDSPNGEDRNYRMRVTLQHKDDRWLVADVEFVP